MDFVIEKRDFLPGILEKVRKANRSNKNLKDAYIIFRTALLLEECELSAYFFLQFLYYMANKPGGSEAIKNIDGVFKKMNSNHFSLPEEWELWSKAKVFAIESSLEDVLSYYEAITPDDLKCIRVRQYTWEGAQMTINNHQERSELLNEFQNFIQDICKRQKEHKVKSWLLTNDTLCDIEVDSFGSFYAVLPDDLRIKLTLSEPQQLLYWYFLKVDKVERLSLLTNAIDKFPYPDFWQKNPRLMDNHGFMQSFFRKKNTTAETVNATIERLSVVKHEIENLVLSPIFGEIGCKNYKISGEKGSAQRILLPKKHITLEGIRGTISNKVSEGDLDFYYEDGVFELRHRDAVLLDHLHEIIDEWNEQVCMPKDWGEIDEFQVEVRTKELLFRYRDVATQYLIFCKKNRLANNIESATAYLESERMDEEDSMNKSFQLLDEIREEKIKDDTQYFIDQDYYLDWVTKLMLSGIDLKEISGATCLFNEDSWLVVNDDYSIEVFDANNRGASVDLDSDELAIYLMCLLLSQNNCRLAFEQESQQIACLSDIYNSIQKLQGRKYPFESAYSLVIPNLSDKSSKKKPVDYKKNFGNLRRRINRKLDAALTDRAASRFHIESGRNGCRIEGAKDYVIINPNLDMSWENCKSCGL
ncbi:MAG: hypothetical protein LIP09_09755 [Bacteroidales bacterium]|nr:hypothetical protein [Bacteroidales bacterium]